MTQDLKLVEKVAFEDLVPFFITQLDLQGLACLAACSRDLRTTCVEHVQRHASSFFEAAWEALQAAPETSGCREGAQMEHNSDHILQEQHRQTLVWLLLTAPAVAAVTPTADLLLRIPSMPKRWVLQLVAAGVRITYSQLLAAARSMVAGVEVWVQAQQQLGVQTDIPEVAVAVCCEKASRLRLLPVVDSNCRDCNVAGTVTVLTGHRA
jgi:hypothetical protein